MTVHMHEDMKSHSEVNVEPVWVLGLPLAPLSGVEVVSLVDLLIQGRTPSYFITANLNYAMLTARHEDLHEINRLAAFLVADGMPLIWESRRRGTPLPERVTGSDLIEDLAQLAANRGFRVFLLGGPPEVSERAATILVERYPGLQIAGVEAPDLSRLSELENARLVQRIRQAGTDLLLVALGQPKGERWIYQNYDALGVPVSVQVGASFEFVAGKIPRAPAWMRRHGLEWVFRLALEPHRLGKRYFQNALFYLRHRIATAAFRPSNQSQPNKKTSHCETSP